MVVQCESCQTEFNLDDSLLRKDGTKVRCSRCRHVFKAYPPSPALPAETDESPGVLDDAAPIVSEKAGEVVSETAKGLGKDEGISAGVELESDLDLIYRDVFSEDENRLGDDEIEPEDKVDEMFREANRREEDLANHPPPVFPAMDTTGEDDPSEREGKKVKDKPKSTPPPKKKSSKSSMKVLIPLLFIVLAVAAAYYVWQAKLIPPAVLSLVTRLQINRSRRMRVFGFCSSVQ